VIGHAFIVLDDFDYVTANTHIHGGLRWSTIKWAFTSTEAANWHPLTWLSHALDYQLFALNPAGHHFDSVLIHALNAVLLFLLLSSVTKRVGPSLLVAALFALHPINVESVAWVAERKNVLSTLFFFLAIGAYGWYAQKPDWRRYLLVAALFAAGLMAKPMVITLPFVLLLLDYWPLERMPLKMTEIEPHSSFGVPRVALSRLLLEKIPLLFLSAASAWITLIAQRAAERTLGELPLGIRIENAVVAYGLYLWKMIWPARLAFYPHSVIALPVWQWILSALVLISVTAAVVRFRRKRYLPVGWFWFLGTLIPVIGLVQVGEYAMADRYAYIPLIGIFVMIAWSLADWAEAKEVRMVWRVIPALCALAALACVTNRQVNFWGSDYELWSHTLEGAENPLTHNALGVALMHPDSEMTRHELENLGTEQNRMDEARRHFERALELRQPLAQQNPGAYLPDMARTLNNLGNLDRLQNRMDQARRNCEGALEIYRQLAQQNPDVYVPYLAATLNNLGSLDRLQNRMDEARQHDQEALKIHRQLAEQNPAKYLPNIAMTLNEFGFLDASQNRMDEARQHYEEALKIDRQLAEQSPAAYLPDLAMTLTDFGLLDASQNRMDEARWHYGEALKIHRQLAEQDPAVYLPDMAMTLNNLARVDRLQNRIEESRAYYTEALTVYRKLAQGDLARYAGDVARVEASLEELGNKAPSQ
jgi:tetratricopeptide (TPR) repeat protein